MKDSPAMREILLVKKSNHLIRMVRRIDAGYMVLDLPGRPHTAVFPDKRSALAYAKRPEESDK